MSNVSMCDKYNNTCDTKGGRPLYARARSMKLFVVGCDRDMTRWVAGCSSGWESPSAAYRNCILNVLANVQEEL